MVHPRPPAAGRAAATKVLILKFELVDQRVPGRTAQVKRLEISHMDPRHTVAEAKAILNEHFDWGHPLSNIDILFGGVQPTDDKALDFYPDWNHVKVILSHSSKRPVLVQLRNGRVEECRLSADCTVAGALRAISKQLLAGCGTEHLELLLQSNLLSRRARLFDHDIQPSDRLYCITTHEAASVDLAMPLVGRPQQDAMFAQLDTMIHRDVEFHLRFENLLFEVKPSLVDFEVDVDNPLGEGCNGIVYSALYKAAAQASATNRAEATYALKALWPVGHRTQMQYENEYMVPLKFPHRNIGHVVTSFSDKAINQRSGEDCSHTQYVLLRKYPTNLEKVLAERKSLPEREALLVVYQLLQAIAHLHEHNVSHNDIKASDVCLDGLHVYLCDFGCATTSLVVDFIPNGAAASRPLESQRFAPGHSYNLTNFDTWAAGLLCYSLAGLPHPFWDDETKQIIPRNDNPPFPHTHPKLKQVMELLLTRETDKRTDAANLVRHVGHFLWPLQRKSQRAAPAAASSASGFLPRLFKAVSLSGLSRSDSRDSLRGAGDAISDEDLFATMKEFLANHPVESFQRFESQHDRLQANFLMSEAAVMYPLLTDFQAARLASCMRTFPSLFELALHQGFSPDCVSHVLRRFRRLGRVFVWYDGLVEELLKEQPNYDGDAAKGGAAAPDSSSAAASKLAQPQVKPAPLTLPQLPTVKTGCVTQSLCQDFVSFLKLGPEFLDPHYNRCFCRRCPAGKGQDRTKLFGEPPFPGVIPYGWVRVGLCIDPATTASRGLFRTFYRSFHGTDGSSAVKIIEQRGFLHRGQVTHSGHRLPTCVRNHFQDGQNLLFPVGDSRVPNRPKFSIKERSSEAAKASPLQITAAEAKRYPGAQVLTPSKTNFTSPSLQYASRYTNEMRFNGRSFRVVLQCRQSPGSVNSMPSTLGSINDPDFPDSEIAWFTDFEGSIIFDALLVQLVET
eukprot:m.15441 g.15441  ORF g.15441 m.15441 type:complete len:960 (-) comp8456_c0_seq1:56-2935(-)